MRITQKGIARDLGISLITVSRALNDTGYVSGDLKKRILDYAKQKSYVPHKASQVLVRNKTVRLALFSSTLPDYFWNDIKKGMEIAADQILPFNYSVRYHMVPELDSERYIHLLQDEIRGGLHAAAFVNQRLYDMRTIIHILDDAGIPYVTFNVDEPECRRRCYIGSNYRDGGRLAADYIGRALQVKGGGRVLVVNSNEDADRFAKQPDINSERTAGFLSVMEKHYPEVECDVRYITSKLKVGYADSQIEDLLREVQGKVDGVYLIPAFNAVFLRALEKLAYQRTLTLLHDIDTTALRHLETRLLSAVVYQNPILQGYYTVKTLEHILESKGEAPLKDVEIVHNLVLAENRNLHRNQYAPAELMQGL